VIAVVGEALVDLVVAADGAITATSGGAPFNVARACSRLGAPVGLIAAVSTDRFGQRLMADLTADGVRTDRVQRIEAPTGFLAWWMASGRAVDDHADVEAVVPAVDAAHRVAAAIVGRRGADPPHWGELPPDWGPG
jgi:hypothetical protein